MDLMKYWVSVLGDRIYTVEYESLVHDFDAESKSLVEHCGIDWEDSCSEFFKNKRHVSTASQDQVSKPLYSTSVERWRNYEAHITELTDKLKEYKLID